MLHTRDQLFTDYARTLERTSPYVDDALAALQLLGDAHPALKDEPWFALATSRLKLVLKTIDERAPAFALPPGRRNARR